VIVLSRAETFTHDLAIRVKFEPHEGKKMFSVDFLVILLHILAVDVPDEIVRVRARMADKRCHRRHPPHPSLWIGIDEFFRPPSKVSDSVNMVSTRSLSLRKPHKSLMQRRFALACLDVIGRIVMM
jgi:hypothetical protein